MEEVGAGARVEMTNGDLAFRASRAVVRIRTRARSTVHRRAEGVVGLACNLSQTQALTKPSSSAVMKA